MHILKLDYYTLTNVFRHIINYNASCASFFARKNFKFLQVDKNNKTPFRAQWHLPLTHGTSSIQPSCSVIFAGAFIITCWNLLKKLQSYCVLIIKKMGSPGTHRSSMWCRPKLPKTLWWLSAWTLYWQEVASCLTPFAVVGFNRWL
jgi:hypothetical protein